jgi:hypothetical protein
VREAAGADDKKYHSKVSRKGGTRTKMTRFRKNHQSCKFHSISGFSTHAKAKFFTAKISDDDCL